MTKIVKSVPLPLMCAFSLILLMALRPHVNGDVSCPVAVAKLSPCLPFLKDLSGAGISGPCCQGVVDLNNMANTKPVRKSVCECLKQAAQAFMIDHARSKQIPQLCNIQLSITVDPNADCNNA